MVVSQSLAAAALPAEDPLGKPLGLGDTKYQVVGIAADVRVASPQERGETEIYFLAGAGDLPSTAVLVRTSGRPEALLPGVASIAKSVDAKILPVVQMMKSSFDKKLQGSQYGAWSVSLLAAVALLLACLGIVGLVAYAVSQRTREIGIRMALGAKPSHVLSVVLRQFSSPVLAGLVIGVGGAAALTRLLRGLLYGISNLDPARPIWRRSRFFC